MGLHAHQFAGFDHDALAEALGVPATHQLLTGIAVGVPGDPAEVDERTAARDHRDRVRKPLSEWAFGGRFGEPGSGRAGRLGAMTTLSDFSAPAIDGTDTDLSQYDGKVVLVVNTASQCGFTGSTRACSSSRTPTPTRAWWCSASRATSSATRSPATRRRSPTSASATSA